MFEHLNKNRQKYIIKFVGFGLGVVIYDYLVHQKIDIWKAIFVGCFVSIVTAFFEKKAADKQGH